MICRLGKKEFTPLLCHGESTSATVSSVFVLPFPICVESGECETVDFQDIQGSRTCDLQK